VPTSQSVERVIAPIQHPIQPDKSTQLVDFTQFKAMAQSTSPTFSVLRATAIPLAYVRVLMQVGTIFDIDNIESIEYTLDGL
jgi:hypothetical protein